MGQRFLTGQFGVSGLGTFELGSQAGNPCGFFTIPVSFRQRLLSDLVKNFYSKTTLHLFTQQVALTPALTLAQMQAVEANFFGYVPITPLTWSKAFLNGNGDAESDFTLVQFVCYGVVTPQPIWGWFLTFESNLAGVYQTTGTVQVVANPGDTVNVVGGITFGDTTECCPATPAV